MDKVSVLGWRHVISAPLKCYIPISPQTLARPELSHDLVGCLVVAAGLALVRVVQLAIMGA
jgi:hypothetical protein